MLDIVVILVVSYAVLAAAGAVVLSLVPARLRNPLLPALPALGAMGLVLALSFTSLVLPVRVGVVVVALAAAAQLVTATRRERWWAVSARAVRMLAVTTVVGVIPLGTALVPQLRVGEPTVVQPTYNNDAYAYVTLSSWVTDHRALDKPDKGEDAAAYGYTRAHIRGGLRVGEELAQSALALANGRDPSVTWYTVLALWLFLVPGTFTAAAILLKVSRPAGLATGLLVGLAAPVVGQVYTQNSASVLGIAFAPLALALVVGATRGDDDHAVPAWLAGAGLSAFIGTYSEYIPLLAPGFVLFLLLRPPQQWLPTLRRLVEIGLWALVTGPLVWFNAIRSLVGLSDFTAPGSVSAYLDAPLGTKLNRLLGVTTYEGGETVTPTTLLLVAAVAVGLAACVAVARERRFWRAYLIGSALMVVYLSTAHRFPYGQQRAVEISHPLWLFAAFCGFDALVRKARWRHVRDVGIALLAVFAVVFLRANQRTWDVVASGPATLVRNVDEDFAEADRWLEEYGGEDGEHAMVVDTDFFQQLWLIYETRDQPETAFPFVYPDYHDVTRYELFDGRLRRFALVGASVYVGADPGVVVAENERFRLLDLSKGEAVLVAPARNFASPEPRGMGDAAYWMSNDGELVVVRTPGVRGVRLTGGPFGQVAPLPMDVADLDAGRVLGSYDVHAEHSVLDVPLPEGAAVKLVLHNRKPAEQPAVGPDRRFLSFYLTDAERL